MIYILFILTVCNTGIVKSQSLPESDTSWFYDSHFHFTNYIQEGIDIHQFLNGYYDENCYYCCPPDYLPNLNDQWYLSRYATKTKFVLATGERDICLAENLRLGRIMDSKHIPHWLDVWGDGAGHDWAWWQSMVKTFFG